MSTDEVRFYIWFGNIEIPKNYSRIFLQIILDFFWNFLIVIGLAISYSISRTVQHVQSCTLTDCRQTEPKCYIIRTAIDMPTLDTLTWCVYLCFSLRNSWNRQQFESRCLGVAYFSVENLDLVAYQKMKKVQLIYTNVLRMNRDISINTHKYVIK